MKRELCEAMEQLMRQDVDSFARHGLTQITQGAYDETLARAMMDRIPGDAMRAIWTLADQQHEGCLVFTDEGFEDAVAAFPQARTLATSTPPEGDQDLATALRDFCSAG